MHHPCINLELLFVLLFPKTDMRETLASLDLSDNLGITCVTLGAIICAPMLQRLNMESTNLYGMFRSIDRPNALRSIVELNMSDCSLSCADFRMLIDVLGNPDNPIRSLKKLDVSRNRIGTPFINYLLHSRNTRLSFANLEVLDMSCCRCAHCEFDFKKHESFESIRQQSALVSLKSLYLGKTNLDAAEIMRFVTNCTPSINVVDINFTRLMNFASKTQECCLYTDIVPFTRPIGLKELGKINFIIYHNFTLPAFVF